MKQKIHTQTELEAGVIFEMVWRKGTPLGFGETVELWTYREDNGLGREIIYSKGTITGIPKNQAGLYQCLVVDLLDK